MSVEHIFRYGLTRGMFIDEHMLALIFIIMIGSLLKIVSNWAVLAHMEPGCIDLLTELMMMAHGPDNRFQVHHRAFYCIIDPTLEASTTKRTSWIM